MKVLIEFTIPDYPTVGSHDDEHYAKVSECEDAYSFVMDKLRDSIVEMPGESIAILDENGNRVGQVRFLEDDQ